MEKIDYKKDFRQFFSASAKSPTVVEVSEFQYLMTDGEGEPNTSPGFQKAIQTLYGVIFTLKMSWKFKKLEKPPGYVDFTVPPLEGLWWMKDGSDFDMNRKADWRWRLMLMTPDFFSNKILDEVIANLREKRGEDQVVNCRLERWEEGLCVQIMHVGPYGAEGPTLEKLHTFAKEKGYTLQGKHHEIYLGDPRRTSPEKLKTILRQPVV
jgi:hypothetical protein